MIRKLFLNLPEELRFQIFKTLGLVVTNGFFQSFGVVSIAPVLSLIVDPDLVFSSPFLLESFSFTKKLGVDTPIEFIKILAILSIILIAISLILKIYTTNKVNILVERVRHELSTRAFRKYVHQDYENFVKKHSSEYAKVVLSEIDQLSAGFIRPVIQAMGSLVISLILSIFVIVAVGAKSIFIIIMIFGFYLLSNSLIKSKLREISRINLANNKQRFHVVSETLGNIKSLKANETENVFIDRFNKYSYDFTNGVSRGVSLKIIPNTVVESMIYVSLLVAIIIMLSIEPFESGQVVQSNFFTSITIIGLSFIRLKPAIDLTFNGFLAWKSSRPALQVVLTALELVSNISSNFNKVHYSKILELKNIKYSYADGQIVLNGVNVSLIRGESVALTGVTGSGKSTFVDLIMGLLTFTEGEILVDGENLSPSDMASWRNSVSYVTQEALILDDSVEENILFGSSSRDLLWLKKCIQLAQLDKTLDVKDFNGILEYKCGEKGVRLSGGQRQRLAIARALYRKPSLLIMDESTSALDEFTEKLILDAILNLEQRPTILMITHDLSNLHLFDRELKIHNRKIF